MHKAIENFQKRTTEFLDAVALFPDRERSIAVGKEWSAAFVIHHVADAELHFASRYWHILGSENPVMPYFDEDNYPAALGYENRSVAKSLAAISGIRTMVFDVLAAADESVWSRITTAVDGAEFSLTDLLTKADAHMTAHVKQLNSLKTQLF